MTKIVAFIAALFFSMTAWGAGKDADNAKQFIATIGDDVVAIFEKNPSVDEREKALTALFDRSIDSSWMGKFVLGKYWRQASEAQQKQFLSLYKDFLFVNYLPHFKNYNGEKQQVLDVVDEGDGDYMVRTQIVRPEKNAPVHVDYRVHREEGGSRLLIFDIVTEGVSVVTTHRSDFGSVVSQQGIDGLIKRIESKVAPVKTKPSDQ